MWRITGYSSVMPLAPRTRRASRAIQSASRTLFFLPKLRPARGAQLPCVLQAPEVQRHELGLRRSRIAISTSLLLDELEADAIGLVELHARLGVVERRLVAGPRRADRAPGDAEARLVEARQRPSQRRRTSGSMLAAGMRHVVEAPAREVTEARSEILLVDARGGEARRVRARR